MMMVESERGSLSLNGGADLKALKGETQPEVTLLDTREALMWKCLSPLLLPLSILGLDMSDTPFAYRNYSWQMLHFAQ